MALTEKYLDDDFLKKQKDPETIINNLTIALDKGGRLQPVLSISEKARVIWRISCQAT
ncbi:hypothetical protein [Moraxella bovoculi]|uniref:hypothetical protein n=1 Tax=Moraxella bovoculi TaxID=386891 RepID=UPI0012D3D412|nr:hypothetical protein [Moraxella bovoculi]